MSDQQDAARGRRAEHEYTETEDAFAKVRQAIIEELTQTSIVNPDKVLKLHAALQNLRAVQDALMLVIQNGTLASAALAQAGLKN